MSQYRKEQCQMMLDALRGAGLGMTRADFAKLLGIKKGTHLNGLIAELLNRNLATATRGLDRHNRSVFIYWPVAAEEQES
jgi:hypothetical protein